MMDEDATRDQRSSSEARHDKSDLKSEAAVYDRLKRWYKLDDDHNAPFREQVTKDFAFFQGRGQWSDDDIALLKDQRRAPITFNRVLAIVNAVAGIEINDRTETTFLPNDATNVGEARANEMLSGASRWMSEKSNSEDHHSEAFKRATICGAGGCEQVVDFDEDPKGKYTEEVFDIREFRWDCRARLKNFSDSKRWFRVRTVPAIEAMELTGVDDATLIDATWASPLPSKLDKKSNDDRRHETAEGGDKPADPNGDVTLVHAQWIEKEDYWLVSDSLKPGQDQELEPEAYRQYVDAIKEHNEFVAAAGRPDLGVQYKSVKMSRKVVKQAWLGRHGIVGGIADAPCKKRFNWNFITYEIDLETGLPFGMISLMRDPQMFANKWLTQTLHILNTTAKGGVLAEEGVFKDINDAQQMYARPDSIVEVQKNAIKDARIMAKPGAGMAAPYLQMTEFAIAAIRDTPGVSLELLGQAGINQPGILEHQRKQAGLTILAGLFDSRRIFKKSNGIVRLYYIQKYFADGRLVRVTGEQGKQQFIQLLKDQAAGDYDIDIDDAPTSPNMKEQNWLILERLLPIFRDQIDPETLIMILEYSPLPAALMQRLRDKLSQPDPKAEMQQQIAQRAAIGEIKATEAKTINTEADTDKKRAEAMREAINGVIDMISAGVDAKDAEARRMAELNRPRDPRLTAQPRPVDRGQIIDIAPGGNQLPTLPSVPMIPPALLQQLAYQGV